MDEFHKYSGLSDDEFIKVLKTAMIDGRFNIGLFKEIMRRGEEFLINEPGILATYREEKERLDKCVETLKRSVIDTLKLRSLHPTWKEFETKSIPTSYIGGSIRDAGKLTPSDQVSENELVLSAALQGILDQILTNSKTAIRKDWFVVSMYIATMCGFFLTLWSVLT